MSKKTKRKVPTGSTGVPSEVANRLFGCQCCSLADSRSRVVVSSGNIGARVMFIGEAPGEKEDLLGVGFVGKCGERVFNPLLRSLGLRRDDVYIANVCKCRPPGNRTPLKAEINACSSNWLETEINAVGADIVVCLGRVAVKAVMGSGTKFGETGALEYGNALAMYHPSYVMRAMGKESRESKKIIEDFKDQVVILRDMIETL